MLVDGIFCVLAPFRIDIANGEDPGSRRAQESAEQMPRLNPHADESHVNATAWSIGAENRARQKQRTRARAGDDSCGRFEEFTAGSEGTVWTHKNISDRLIQSFTETVPTQPLAYPRA